MSYSSYPHMRASQSTKISRSVLNHRDENINYQPVHQSTYLSKSTSAFIKPRRSLGAHTTKSTKRPTNQSKSMKARPGWQDILLKDPTEYRLSEDQLISRKLKRMSKRQLCEIAGIPVDFIDSPEAMNRSLHQPTWQSDQQYDDQRYSNQPELENEFPWMNQQQHYSPDDRFNEPTTQPINQPVHHFVDLDDSRADHHAQPQPTPPNSRASSRPVSSHSSRLNQSIRPTRSRPNSRPLSPSQPTNESANQPDNTSNDPARMMSLLGRIATHLGALNTRVDAADTRLVDCEARLIDQSDRLIDCERRMAAMEDAFLVLTEENESIKQDLTETINHLETQTTNQATELIKRITSIEEKAAARAAKKRQMLLAARASQSQSQSTNPPSNPPTNLSTNPTTNPSTNRTNNPPDNELPPRPQRRSSPSPMLATPVQQSMNPLVQPSINQAKKTSQSSQQPMLYSRNRPSVPFVSSALSTPLSINPSTNPPRQGFHADDSLLETPQSLHQHQPPNQSFGSPFSLSDDEVTPRSSLPSPYKPEMRRKG